MRGRILAVAVLAACGSRESGTPAGDGMASRPAEPDTLMLRMPDGAEVWFTDAMADSTAGGVPCTTRTMEIRRGETRTPVPLLYTLGPPEPVDDTTVRAALVRECASHDIYLVDTRTAQPRRAP